MKKIISARSLVFELKNLRRFSFNLSFLLAFLAYNAVAFGTTCDDTFPQKIENCTNLSVYVKSSCEFAVEKKMANEALEALNKSDTPEDEKRRGLRVLTGSQYTNDKIDLTAKKQTCEMAIGEYRRDCEHIEVEFNNCKPSISVDSDALALSISEANEALTSSEKKLSDSKKEIEDLDKKIDKSIVSLCENKFGREEGCKKPTPEFTENAKKSFNICSKSYEHYDSSKCITSVKPSVDSNANVSNATPKVTPTTETLAPPEQQSKANPEAPQVKAEASAADQAKAPAQPQAPAKTQAQAPAQVKTEPKILSETTLDSAKSSKNSDFKAPPLGTIAKYVILGGLAYGVVTGKIKTWAKKIVNAINPFSKKSGANTGAGNDSGGASGTTAAIIKGIVKPPSDAEQIAMANRNVANGDGLGGGTNGGIYMQGAFDLKTDANGVVTSSYVTIHGTPGFTAVGRVTSSGTSTLNLKESGIHDVGTLVLIVKKGKVEGKMHHGGGKEWIYGIVDGTYAPTK